MVLMIVVSRPICLLLQVPRRGGQPLEALHDQSLHHAQRQVPPLLRAQQEGRHHRRHPRVSPLH